MCYDEELGVEPVSKRIVQVSQLGEFDGRVQLSRSFLLLARIMPTKFTAA